MRSLSPAGGGTVPASTWPPMEARDGESLSRVDRHRRARAGKGFCTVECPRDLERLSHPFRFHCTVGVSDQPTDPNEMYPQGDFIPDPTGKILAELEHLLERAAHLVVVSGEVFSPPGRRRGWRLTSFALGTLHRELAHRADLVVESVYGIPVYGKCPKGWVE